MRTVVRAMLAAALSLASAACSQTLPVTAPIDGVEQASAGSAGTWQGTWRVTRPNDPDDAALMTLQLRQDGEVLEGEYVLHQPFCGVGRPLPLPSNLDCEFADSSAAFIEGATRNGEARLILRPGADAADHRLIISVEGDARTGVGAYYPPGEVSPTGIRLTRPRNP